MFFSVMLYMCKKKINIHLILILIELMYKLKVQCMFRFCYFYKCLCNYLNLIYFVLTLA